MCMILVAKGVFPDVPLLVAANRDEFLARASLPPQLLSEHPRVVAGVDRERSGTWMGATPHGFFAAVTNQHTGVPPDRSRRSRGELVVELLRAGDVERASRLLDGLDPGRYNGFNLLYGDAERVRVAYGHEGASVIELADVPDGLHVLPTDRLDSPVPKVELALARARALADASPSSEDLVPAVRAILSDHSLPDLRSVCIHTPLYGTRSSTLLELEPGRVARYLFSPEPLCRRGYEDVTSLLRA
jgi:uncharacterized protein with NRDE domain